MFQTPHSFRIRLLLTLLGLAIASQLAVGLWVSLQMRLELEAQTREKLIVATRVLDRAMANRARRLSQSVRVLASDFGFKSAVGTADRPTIQSVLANHGGRIGADLALLADTRGRVLVASHLASGQDLSSLFPTLWSKAQTQGMAVGIVMLNQVPYHLVLVPVEAPDTIGWTAMGFRLDLSLAQSVRNVARQDVAFTARDPHTNEPVYAVTTLEGEGRGLRALLEKSAATDEVVRTADYLALGRELAPDTGHRVQGWVIAGREALQQRYRTLQAELLVIFGVTLLVSVLMAVAMARAISRPLRQLSVYARKIGAGDYRTPSPINDQGELGELAHTLEEMQRRIRQREHRIRYQSRHDSLTGLANRAAMEASLGELLGSGEKRLLVRFSIREFKEINDTLGYQFGDQVLQAIAARARLHIGGDATLARVGGNEFMALTPLASDPADEAAKSLDHLLRTHLERPLVLMESPVMLHLDIGVMVVPDDGDSMQDIWRRSTITLNRSRDQGGKTVVYEQGMDESHLRELTIISEMEGAIREGQFYLMFQPKVMLGDGQVCQFEALARWEHPQLGLIPPDEFIALGERSGQVVRITEWLLEQAFDVLERWHEAGRSWGLALNLSAHDLMETDLVDQFRQRLAGYRGETGLITLEVTESTLMRDMGLAVEKLNALRQMGLKVSIDDFGTGYSSLAQLKNLPADEVKIDKSFILHLTENPEDQLIVQSAIRLGQGLDLEIVAEGVEDEGSWHILKNASCDAAQGFFMGRPMKAQDLPGWMEEWQERKRRL